MPLGQMQVDGSDLEVPVSEQYLNSAQVGTGFKKVGRKTMAQSVGMNAPCCRGRRVQQRSDKRSRGPW